MNEELGSEFVDWFLGGDSVIVDDVLHAGVKGMRWGVRKDRGDKDKVFGSGSKKRSKTPTPEGAKGVPGARGYDPKKMTNAELKAVVNRMKLEQEYTTLNQKTISKGKKATDDLLRNLAVAGATMIFTSVLSSALDKKFSTGKDLPKKPEQAKKAAQQELLNLAKNKKKSKPGKNPLKPKNFGKVKTKDFGSFT